MSLHSNFSSTEPLSLLLGYKCPAVFAVFEVGPALSPIAAVLNKGFFII